MGEGQKNLRPWLLNSYISIHGVFIVMPKDLEDDKAFGEYLMFYDQNVGRIVDNKVHSDMMSVEMCNKLLDTRKNHLCHKVAKNCAHVLANMSQPFDRVT